MAHIDVNLDEVQDQGEAHPEGLTLVRIAKAEIKSKKGDEGSKYINWQLEPIGTDNHRPLFLITSLKTDALWNLKGFLKEAGVQWNSDGSFDTEEALGAEVHVTVGLEEYDGQIRNRVKPPYKRA
jgi:hypothetical protein